MLPKYSFLDDDLLALKLILSLILKLDLNKLVQRPRHVRNRSNLQPLVDLGQQTLPVLQTTLQRVERIQHLKVSRIHHAAKSHEGKSASVWWSYDFD